MRQAPKTGYITLTDGSFASAYPSGIFREKILLKYNEQGQLVVIATDLNGVRITKNPSQSYYVEGKSNLDYDFCLLGYGTAEDAEIIALNAKVGDIFIINSPRSKYTSTERDVKAIEGLTGYIVSSDLSEPEQSLEHNFTETYVDATCEQASGILKECTICDLTEYIAYTEDNPLYMSPKGHMETIYKSVAATCSQTGLTQGSGCKTCGKILVKQSVIAKNPDAHIEQLVEIIKEATCTENGIGRFACKDCKQDLGEKEIVSSHEFTIVEEKAATCGTNGAGYKKCVLCGYTIKDVVISATGKHTYGDWVVDVEPTTSTEGIKSKHCSVCGHRSEITSIPCIK